MDAGQLGETFMTGKRRGSPPQRSQKKNYCKTKKDAPFGDMTLHKKKIRGVMGAAHATSPHALGGETISRKKIPKRGIRG